MPNVPTPDVKTQVKNLIALLDEINLQCEAPTPTGACLYKAGGQTTCCMTTEAWCEQGLRGSYIGGTCQGQRPDIPNADVDEGTIARLVAYVNHANSLLPEPEPIGMYTYPSGADDATIQTTEACARALAGVFAVPVQDSELDPGQESTRIPAHA
jgi:hypothetical protein